MTSDVAAAQTFYGALFGWEFEGGGEEFGGYFMAKSGGRNVAGLFQSPPDHPTAWTTYLASDDIDATASKIEAAGGKIAQGPVQVMEAGSMLLAQDPTGGFFGVWQPNQHIGFGVSSEPNSVVWNEFVTRDYGLAKDFFSEVFGYTYDEVGDGESQYSMIKVGDRPVGGLGVMPAGTPEQVPSYWRTYFAVADTDASVEQIGATGGRVEHPPTDMPYGRYSDVVDPQGGQFSVLRMPQG